MPQNPPPLPDFTRWPSFPFEGDMRVKTLAEPVDVEPPRSGEDAEDCVACNTPDDAYIWVSERWRVRGMDRPTGLPMVLILECRSHLDIGDLPNLLAAELGVMTVRLERAIRSLDGVARVHVNRWGDGSAHLHMWFLARPYGRLQLRGTFLSLWDDILPVIPEEQWLENLALVAEWLAGFGGRAIAEPPHIHWQSPSTFGNEPTITPDTPATPDTWQPPTHTDSPSAGFTWNNATPENQEPVSDAPTPAPSNSSHPESDGAAPATTEPASGNSTSEGTASGPASRSDLTAVNAETRDLSSYAIRPATTPTLTDEPNTNPPATAAVTSPTPSAPEPTAPGQPGEAPTPEPPSASSPASAAPAESPSTDASGTGTAPTTASTPAPPATSNPTLGPDSTNDGAGQATQSEPSAARAIPSQPDAKTAEAAANPDRRPAAPQSATATDTPAPTQAAPSH